MDSFAWPALQMDNVPSTLAVQRAVWGKAHHFRTDYRWLAATPDFAGRHQAVEHALILGDELVPKSFVAWRVVQQYAYAVVCYPSQAEDADGRSGFLEKQMLEWQRPTAIPAALGLLLCLPKVWQFDDRTWWPQRNQPDWDNPDFVLSLAHEPPLAVDSQLLTQVIDTGIHQLSTLLTEELLINFYAYALAGYPVTLPDLASPLPPEALAALLLPLPRARADRLSLTTWLPVTKANSKELFKHWDALFCSQHISLKNYAKSPNRQQVQQAQTLTEALLTQHPQLLQTQYSTMASTTQSNATTGSDIHLTLWGPSSSGKTVFLAQLDIAASANMSKAETKVDWQIFPKPESMPFTDAMREQMRKENRFPKATTGSVEQIIFTFKKDTAQATLRVDDRPGAHYENYVSLQAKTDKTELEQHFATTEGFVLLFDPDAETARLSHQIWSTVQRLGYDNPRPVAICVSKSDLLVNSTDDYKAMTSTDALQQHRFVENYLLSKDERLTDTIKRYTTNYRFFPVSAAGIRHQYGIIESVVFYDESMSPRVCSEDDPLNLLAPFCWVLDEIIKMRDAVREH